MKCAICDCATEYYFSKTYTEPPFADFMKDIGTVHYHRCTNCHFVFSRTHAELPPAKWEVLNHQFHHHLEDPESKKLNAQPPYAEQALMLVMLAAKGIIDLSVALDYAAGYGTLSTILADYFKVRLPIYDPYIKAASSSCSHVPESGQVYRTVINSAMFEHVLRREDLDQVNQLVAPDGCLVLHTVVCENVPADPDWFYIRIPVHTAFHTNRSMQLLMDQWGYQASLYCPPSKCWVLFKHPPQGIEADLASLNTQLQSPWFLFKKGFVDYWKGF